MNRYSNIASDRFDHSPYYVPNFNNAYFNSPSFFTNPNQNNYNSFSSVIPDANINIKNSSYSVQNSNSNFTQSTHETHVPNDHTVQGTNTKAGTFDFERIFRMSGNTISIFDFSIDIDDLIIIAILVFLIYEKCDDIYLIILLGLLFFDIKLDFWK